MKKTTFLFWLFTLIACFSVNTQAQTYKVNYQQNGFEGYIQFEIVKDHYAFGEPTFKIRDNVINVITSYQTGKHSTELSKKGINFPKTLNVSTANNTVKIIGKAVFYMNTAKTVTHKSQPEVNLSLYDPFLKAPDFSTEAIDYLKEYGKNHNVSLWKQTGELTNLRVKDVYFNDFKNEVEKIIRDTEREQKEQERKLAEEKKQKEEQAKKEQLAKEEADKKVAASDTEKQTSGKQETQSSQNVQSTEGEKTVTGNSENEFKQTAEMKERENAARKKQEDYERQERERVKNLQKKQEYDQRMSQQRSVNQSIAASNATSSMGMLVVLGGFVYSNMGKVSPNNIFRGSNGYFGMDLGYGTNLTPMYFNSSYENMTTGGKIQYRDEVIAAQPFIINFNVRPKLGYEHEKGGGYVYGSFNPGASIVFHATDLTYTYGIRGFGGGKGLQFLFDLEKGQRKLNVNQYIDPQEFGRGKTNIKYTNLKLGAKFDWYPNEYSAARKTLVLGVIKEIISPEIEPDEEWGRFEIQNIKFEEEPNGLYGLFSKDKRSYTGYFLEYQTAHHSKFMISAFPKYPYTGYVAYSKSTLEKESGFYIQISYTRSIDLFF